MRNSSWMLLVGTTLATEAALPARAVDVDELRSGLVAVYNDAAGSKPVGLVRLDPTVAVSWRVGETAHPRLSATGGEVRWTGYVHVLRAGTYRFHGVLRGQLAVTVADQTVLSAEVNDDHPRSVEGPDVRLDAGIQPLAVRFVRRSGTARLELRWQGPGFRSEPLPSSQLFHLPSEAPKALAEHQELERGRFLVEENNCVRCHQPDPGNRMVAGLAWRPAPDLSQIGQRAYADWLVHWLLDPGKVRPGAAMPRMFADDRLGRAEAYAVARYLASLGGPTARAEAPPKDDKKRQAAADQGRRLFVSVGCIACHGEGPQARPKDDPASGRRLFPLGALGSKWPENRLASYLRNPLAVDPSGRMPHMLLTGSEAEALAAWLCEASDPELGPTPVPGDDVRAALEQRLGLSAEESAALARLTGERQWQELGQRLVRVKNCGACHTIAPGGQPLPAGPSAPPAWAAMEAATARGCLGDEAAHRGAAPTFSWSEPDRQAVRRFLDVGVRGAGSPSPAYQAQQALHRFNCLACHVRDGRGGLDPEQIEQLQRYEKVEHAELLTPPPLTGVGHKLRTPWLRQVLTQAGRARPWMGLRMPQFGSAQVGTLAEGLAYLDGSEPDDTVHAVPLSPATIETGRQLVGKAAFGCASCHDIAGHVTGGTRGPDLATMSQRVRYDWYLRWLTDAQRIQPGTRMPTVFPEGRSLLDQILGGRAEAQAAAMWAYLSLGPTLPLPDGLEPPKGLVVTVGDRPVLLRTFMPDSGTRSLAIGYPGGVALVYDLGACRLSYAWSGNFLDAAAAWANRGGAPAKPLGNRFWTAPPGCPWAVGTSDAPPDFASRAQDPAYGGPLPPNKVLQGPPQLHFLGYGVDRAGKPTIRYRLGAGDATDLEVAERPEPLKLAGVAFGVQRRFRLRLVTATTPWFWAGVSPQPPRPVPAETGATEIGDQPRLLAASTRLVLPQEGQRALVLALAQYPPETHWLVQRKGPSWQVLVRLPSRLGEADLVVNVWAPFRDDPALLKEIMAER
ncbi:MAG: c-type cytochrome [Gemmataceae bacterium]|nr:c-type cytochrome [Gemmataceae bacterium]MDW8266981.1 c-type cytochrome [Gemmataceae bacterium]